MNSIGIDFGTTNSAVSVHRTETDEIISGEYEPTLLYFEESNKQIYHIGTRAIEKYLENGLRGRFIRSIKSILHFDNFHSTRIYGKKYTAEELVALILGHFMDQGKDILGGTPERVVLGRPARFSPDPKKDALAQERLRKAAEIAGFKQIDFQLEPIAAAYTYERSITKEELVLVGDFGGGTADFTLMRLGGERKGRAGFASKSKRREVGRIEGSEYSGRPTDRSQDILGATGVRVGGDDFDGEIAWGKIVKHLGCGLEYDSNGRGKMLPLPIRFYRKFIRWENHFLLNSPNNIIELEKYYRWTRESKLIADFLNVIQNNLGYSLFRSIENGKIGLTEQDLVTIRFHERGVDIEEELALKEFEGFIQKYIDQLDETINGLLEEVGISGDEVDSVFLTGGSSLVRAIRGLMERKFGSEKIRDHNAFTSVAEGLALQAGAGWF